MSKKAAKKKRPDFSEVALRIVKEATDETDLSLPPNKTPHKVAKALPKKPE